MLWVFLGGGLGCCLAWFGDCYWLRVAVIVGGCCLIACAWFVGWLWRFWLLWWVTCLYFGCLLIVVGLWVLSVDVNLRFS